ncbi:MAG: hypothetical protein OMM_06664 [Candidatus Magnetoglobus multicellularis str. Araruama]|uniref:Uncharacterized protein n=1 Tax=Candidatus Magnetoglobus multicellularis str. Araruama TaxID=890399 RepID=A0A1V1PGL2_9BACT|nr:MAG: hypothetical protein OMM_06664 [Candidatus Magnetoglobus multicellularis str. Araruama]
MDNFRVDRSKYFVIRLVGRTLCSPRTKTSIKPMRKTNVGANLMFALRTKTAIKPILENELETFALSQRASRLSYQWMKVPVLFDLFWISVFICVMSLNQLMNRIQEKIIWTESDDE